MTNAQLKSTLQRAKTQHKQDKKQISDITFTAIIDALNEHALLHVGIMPLIQRAKTQHKLRKKRISDTTFNSIIEFLESKLEQDK